MSNLTSRAGKGLHRDLDKELFWRKTLREQAGGGLDIRAFCRARGLTEPSFYAWRRMIAQRDGRAPALRTPSRRTPSRRPSKPHPTFVELRPRPEACPPGVRMAGECRPGASTPGASTPGASTPAPSMPAAFPSGEFDVPLEIVVGHLRLLIRPGCDRALLAEVLAMLTLASSTGSKPGKEQ